MSQPRSASGRYLDWNLIIERAREAGGRWMLLEAGAPARLDKTIRLKQARQLRALKGERLESRIVNKHRHMGSDRGDLYVRMSPE